MNCASGKVVRSETSVSSIPSRRELELRSRSPWAVVLFTSSRLIYAKTPNGVNALKRQLNSFHGLLVT